MSKEKQKKPNKLSPFEQNRKNKKEFPENVKIYETVELMVEAAKALNFVSGSEEPEFNELEEMLKSTMISFSEFIEDKGGKWN